MAIGTAAVVIRRNNHNRFIRFHMTPSSTFTEPRGSLSPSGVRTAEAVRRPLPPRPIAVSPQGSRTGWAMRCVYLASDIVAFALSLALATLAVDLVCGVQLGAVSTLDVKINALLAIGLLLVATVQGTYGAIPPRPVRKFRGWVLGAAAVCLAVVAEAWLLEIGTATRYLTLAAATGLAILLASFCRAICRILFGSAAWWGTRLIVVGTGGLAAKAYADLAREPQWGLRPVGFVDDAEFGDAADQAAHNLGLVERLDELAAEFDVDWALVAVHTFDADVLADLLTRTTGQIRHWIILPPLERYPSVWLEACEAARRPALTVTNRLALPWSGLLKQTLDLAVTIVLSLAALPLISVIALLIKLGSPGPIFYGQERIGRQGRRFKAWKFRTMLPDADAVLSRYLDEHPELAAEWKANHKLRCDPRITWIGHWLRVTSLDELPQVWNVLCGEMSLVGPRPIVAAEIDKYAESYEHYMKVLPGITGLWQVSGRNNTTYQERVSLDVYYIQNWSLWLDIYILACTAKVVLLREGAY
jgi:Undecaprenyl-phosphate galactose phosphotransferase WbaP